MRSSTRPTGLPWHRSRARGLVRELGGALAALVVLGCASRAPTAPLPRATLATYLAGQVSLGVDDPLAALFELRAAQARTPDEPELAVAVVRALAALAAAVRERPWPAGQAALAAAQPELTRALRRWPRHAALWHAAAELWRARGLPDAAERGLRRALAIDPASELAALALLSLLQARGDDAGARGVAAALLRYVPDSVGARLVLARALVSAGEHRAAVAELRAVLRKDPDDLDARSLLAAELAWLGVMPEAIEQARSAFDRSGEHLELAEPLFWLLCEAGDRAAALDLLALYDDPQRDVAALVAALGWALQLGELAAAQRLSSRALAAAQVVVPTEAGTDEAPVAPVAPDEDPQATAAVLAAAEVAVFAGDGTLARQLLWLPQARAAPRAQALLFMRLVERDDPAAALAMARTLPEAQWRPRLRLAAARAEAALAPGPAGAAAARAWLPAPASAPYETALARAELELELDEPQAAEAFARRALAARPESPRALELVARLSIESHASRRGLADAGALLARARALAPGRPSLLAARSAWLRETGALDDALTLAVRAATLAPHDPDVAWHLGKVFDARGQHAAARLAYQRAAALRPRPALAARLRAALR